MKPLKLQFIGLNSYRSLQVIDFERLGADGLFGVFGPTGSGKSSILDAITLALYGGVDRAVNHTRGIIHQLEKALEVSFQFELGGSSYWVERRYERNPKDPEATVAKQARLRKMGLDGSEEVLASKPQEVTAKIESILGIRREEFARAVVLPQGKFDQFLRLTGADRAAMLEHLFNLEQFGEALVIKVKNEALACAGRLQRITGEAEGLGDCSLETIRQAETDLAAKNTSYQVKKQAFEEIDRAYREAVAVAELFTKRQEAASREHLLLEERTQWEEQELRLRAAERAEPLRELILRKQNLSDRIFRDTGTCQSNTAIYEASVTRHKEMQIQLQQAEQSFETQMPVLQEQKTHLQGVLDKQKKLSELNNDAAAQEKELLLIVQGIAKLEKEIASCQNEWETTRTALGSLQEKKAELLGDPGEKERVLQGVEVLIRLEEGEKRFAEKRQAYMKRQTEHENHWQGVADKIREMAPDLVLEKENEIETWARSLLSQTENELFEIRLRHQRALVRNAAAEMVNQLHDGEACPVCGSKEHPHPAQIGIDVDGLAKAMQDMEKKLQETQVWERELQKRSRDWAIHEPFVREALEEMKLAQTDLTALSADFERVRGSWDRDGLRRRKQELAEGEKRLREMEQEREILLNRQEKLHETVQKYNERLQNGKLRETVVRETGKNLKTQAQEIAAAIFDVTGGENPANLIAKTEQSLCQLREAVENAKSTEATARAATQKLQAEIAGLQATLRANQDELSVVAKRLAAGLEEAGFPGMEQAQAALMHVSERQTLASNLEEYRKSLAIVKDELLKLDREINGRECEPSWLEQLTEKRQNLSETVECLKAEVTLAQDRVEKLREKQARWQELRQQQAAVEKRKHLAEEMTNLLRGRKLVSFLAQEHLRDMTLEASYQLGRLTGQRYALELAKEKDCEFVIRDDYNGGNRRMIASLSGGEVFLTSLALALALSSKIQLRGRYPLGFFFLDEGFGTLDEEKLDKVMNALEKLHDKHRIVGIISHVRELKERLPHFLEVIPAGEDGSGSEIRSVF